MARSTTPKTETPNASTVAKPKRAPKPKAEVVEKAKPKAREVSAENQAVVDRILTMRREGKGLPTIANTLNAEGVKPFGTGQKWYPPVVRGICLRNGVEKG